MDWTEEAISRLRGLWQEGLSTAEIGRRMSITKNAVVGKAHRLTLPARPSPIRKTLIAINPDGLRPGLREPMQPSRTAPAGESARIAQFLPRAGVTPENAGMAERSRDSLDAAASVTSLRAVRAAAAQAVTAEAAPLRAADVARASPGQANAGRQYREADEPRPASTAASLERGADQPAPRRRGQSCCWPLGDPGTKQFRFCGGEPLLNKPYCAEHAQLAYVKLRDRRETVA